MYLEKQYRNRFKIASKGRVLLMVSAMASCVSLSYAAPTGGVVSSGSATINTSGMNTTINQSTQKAIINWQDFSIGKNETVDFKQPNASAITLNRVVGSNKSILEGTLNANGKVYLVNQNGVLISKGAKVSVYG
ncbi:filamentous hemagglutinin N-terminal domain-containing protein [Sulfuricurvum sp.]|uniref:two-partner secretion domain-containing protein n=1 Tax=Sulfuricurvum sp. TaxID=2025608 RepID=UPI00260796EC|nr:filamentous hemagglutinin N-terminal domain-containing protein [Sulfuricurvum sp.]MDD3598297.1 filamentous hemagglutinin N-terminal domain-containing protein [Sulfuricurvum sp.]